jgi:serine/threonine protein kinase
MGNFLWKCLLGSPQHIIDCSDGDELAYNERFLEDVVLGEGEFGVVKLVHDMKAPPPSHGRDFNSAVATTTQRQPMACKILRKGVVFKDNILYSPLKPHILRGEIEILKVLAGRWYCLQLHAVYETPKCIYMVTEYCAGGQLTEYVAAHTALFTITHVQRIASQLMAALAHCQEHNVLHRDIKPDNIMFTDPTPDAAVRIIDFGSGTLDKPATVASADEMDALVVNGLKVHTTFCGSAFFTSPEMFTHTGYTAVTDVWSMGVSLYVLVAGYPADALQRAFNILQINKQAHCKNVKEAAAGRLQDLKQLPNLPQDLPDAWYQLLNQCLVFNYHHRRTAKEILDSNDFISLAYCHDNNQGGQSEPLSNDAVPELLSLEQVSAAAAKDHSIDIVGFNGSHNTTANRNGSMSLAGSVHRHGLFLDFKKFERSLTTLLAAMLSKAELSRLLSILWQEQHDQAAPATTEALLSPSTDSLSASAAPSSSLHLQQQTLAVIRVSDLKTVIQTNMIEQQESMYVQILNWPPVGALTLAFSFPLVSLFVLSYCVVCETDLRPWLSYLAPSCTTNLHIILCC